MSSSAPRPLASSSTYNPAVAPEKSYFETQRAALIGEIAVSLEHVLANINKLNRSLEGVIAVGNEFSSVEALWSQFENVMAKDPDMEEGSERGNQHEEEKAEHVDASSEEVRGR